MKIFLTLLSILLIPLLGWAEDSAPKADDAPAVSETIPSFPVVMIGGKNVMEIVRKSRMEGGIPVPESISDNRSINYLKKRVKITPFEHNPETGRPDAPITVIEMFDLSCIQCMVLLEEANKAFEEFEDDIRIVHLFNPTETSAPSRLVPFYGKIAQDNDKFWGYHEKAKKVKNSGLATYFNILIKLGMDPIMVRHSTMLDAPRFYRELDADVALLRKIKVEYSPLWLVNGIKVSERAIPVEKMKAVLTYELAKVKADKKRAREK